LARPWCDSGVFRALRAGCRGPLCLLLELVVVLPLLPGVCGWSIWRRIGLLLAAAAVGVPIGNLVLTRSEPEPMVGQSPPSFSVLSYCWQAAALSRVGRAP